MKKHLTKLLAVFLSVCLLFTTSVFAALAEEGDCPIESLSLTIHRPMYENVDGYWDFSEETGDKFFFYDIEEYIRNATTINLFYTDGSIKNLTYDEYCERADLSYDIGIYSEYQQYEVPLQVGDEIEAYFDLNHIPSNTLIYYDFTTSIEESPIESITAEATKSLIENISGDRNWDEIGGFYNYDISLTEPNFTIKWKDTSKEDTTIRYSDIKNTLYTTPIFISNQNSENEWSAGNTYTVTAGIFGAECDFDVSVISLDVVGISAKATHKAILGVDVYQDWDSSTYQHFYAYDIDRFFPEITLTFSNGSNVTIDYDEFYRKTNNCFDLSVSSNQTLKTPWDKAGNYSFDIELSYYDNPDFTPLTCTMPVEIIENPIAKIEAVATRPLNSNDYWWESAYDELTGEYLGEYKYYSYAGSPLVTIYYTDGMVKGPMDISQIDNFDGKYSVDTSSDQSYDNPWEAGTHKCTLEFMGRSCEYDVLLTDRFVKSIRVVDAKISDDNGYYNEENNFIFYTDFDFDLEFTLWDDSKVIESVCGDNWTNYGYIEVTTDQETTPWGKDKENAFTVTLTDNFDAVSTTTGNVEITEYFEYDYDYTDNGIIITGYFGKLSGIMEIPEEIYGDPVVAISSLYSHYGNSDLVEGIVIPDSVTSISDYILSDFENLKSLKLGSGLAYIPETLTVNNPKLEALEISAENEEYYSSQNAIFTKDKTQLVAVAPAYAEMITLPAECTDISVLYDYSEAYKNIKIGYQTEGDYYVTENGITYSKDKKTVISCDTKITGAVVLPNTVTKINKLAFAECDKITAVTLPNSVTNIAYGAFADCTSLSSVTLSSSLNEIGSWAFVGCTALTSITLPNKLESIETAAFRESGIKSITIPDSVISIGKEVFTATPIETAKLGSGLKNMRASFLDCEKLKSVNIPAGIESFESAFLGCTALNSVTLENGLKTISKNAFSSCSALTSITIPSSVTGIEENAFMSTGLKSITIPDSVTYLGEAAFGNCRDLTSATIGSGLYSIGLHAFSGTGLKTINWGENVETIESLAFAFSELESIEIPNTVTSIMYAAFDGSSELSSIKIPSSVKSVGAHAFDETAWYKAQDKGLTYIDNILYRYKGDVTAPTVVNIKNGTRLIADAAFEHLDPENDDPEFYLPDSYYDLSGITKINIPNSVTGIGNLAFASLPGITEITLPDSLTSIGKFPFLCCENLKTLDIGKSTADFNEYTFIEANALEEIIADPQNTKYTTLDGVLYDKNMTTLIYCPAAKTGDLVVPVSVKSVKPFAFSYTGLNSITFQNPQVDIHSYAFGEYAWYYTLCEDYYEIYNYSLYPDNDVILKGAENSWVQYFADNYGLSFEAVEAVKEQETGISVSETVENAIPSGAALVVETIETTEEDTVIFDITLECDGEAVQPDAPVTVSIPLPVGIDPTLCKVYRLEEDGSKTNMNATVTNNFIYFTTDHFSLYVIESSFMPGDINGDGVVDLVDVVTLSQLVAEWQGVNHIEAALDPNGDGNMDLTDVVILSQYVAEWEGIVLSEEVYSK